MSATANDSFAALCQALFEQHFARVYRVLQRFSGEPELAADLTQDAFLRLYQRGSPPDAPEAWLITVGLNLMRNAKSTQTRRARLLAADDDPAGAASTYANEGDSEQEERVRSVLQAMPERDQQLLLLRSDGYSYRDMASALELNEASVGTLLARAKHEFRTRYEGAVDAFGQ